MKKIIFLLISFLWLGYSTKGQLTIQPNTILKTSGNVFLVLQDVNLVNNGVCNTSGGAMLVVREGANSNAVQEIGGSGTTTLGNITINRNIFEAKLTAPIDVNGDMNFLSGLFNLNGNNITLTGTGQLTNESESSRLTGTNGGYVIKTVDLNNPNAINPGNLGFEITSASNLGLTTIRRTHQPQILPAGNAFQRVFEITPTTTGNLNATLNFFYFDAENPAIAEANLKPWNYTPQSGWTQQTPNSHDVNINVMSLSGVNDLSLWTLAGDQTVDNDGDGLSLAQGDCDDGNTTVTMNLTLNNNPIPPNYYLVSDTIFSAGNIQSNNLVIFQAGVNIQMLPGFVATQGTDFRAFIATCGVPPAPLTVISENEISENENENEKNEIEQLELNREIDESFEYQVFPNPMQDKGYVNIMLEKESEVEILLFNQMGQLVKTILSSQKRIAGEHLIEYHLSDTESGVYYVRIQLDRDVFTEKIIVTQPK